MRDIIHLTNRILEEVVAAESLISCKRIFFHENGEDCKTTVYILSEDETKLQTLEDFKNNNENYIDFEIDDKYMSGEIGILSTIKLGVDEQGNEIKAKNVLTRDIFTIYDINHSGKFYTKVECLEEFIESNDEWLRELKENNEEKIDEEALLKEAKAFFTHSLLHHNSEEDTEEEEL